jgi:gas vesicle protein
MLNEQEMIQRDMERTRGSLTEKLEALEGQVADTVSSTAGAVQDTTQSVQETVTGAVDAVKETVETVTDKVQETMNTVTDKFQETVQSVSDTFNLRLQMERHPWIVLGGAVAVGCIVGSSFGSSSAADVAPVQGSGPPPAPPPWNGGTSYASKAPSSKSAEPGIWSGVFSHLKDIGVSYLMGALRDLARNELPEAIASRIAEEVDTLTAKLGIDPIPGQVLPEKKAPESESEGDKNLETRPGYQEKKGNNYRGRSTATVN